MEVNLNIEKTDMDFVKGFLKGKIHPVPLNEVTRQIAWMKTMDDRKNKVKIYNPNSEYKAGDMIFKEYPGKIPIGMKNYVEITGGVVLRVVDVRTRFGANEIKLKYEGTSIFKKYSDFLEKQKIELLLPHKQIKPPEKPEYLTDDLDPRSSQDPLSQKDFNHLEKKLVASLHKESELALICNHVMLAEEIKLVDDESINKIKDYLLEFRKSQTTEYLVEHILQIKPDSDLFSAMCFALNYRLQKDFKIDFQQTSSISWGKWNLISVIYYMKKNALVSEENPLLQGVKLVLEKDKIARKKELEDILSEKGARLCLTQREITSGSVRLYPGNYNLGDSVEVELQDGDTKQLYSFYYYKDQNLLLGFSEIFKTYKALQAMLMSIDQIGEGRFQFLIRTSKKGTVGEKVEYAPETKVFQVHEEKIASTVFVQKLMYLEPDIFQKVEKNIESLRNSKGLNQLIHRIFIEFGSREKNYELHVLRLYHILDLIYPVGLGTVIDALLSSQEFVSAEKIAGMFYLDSQALIDIEKEDRKLRAELQDVEKKIQEEHRQKKFDEDRRQQDEIRHIREERRKQREDEMRMKEKIEKEREIKKAIVEPVFVESGFQSRKAAKPAMAAPEAHGKRPPRDDMKGRREAPFKEETSEPIPVELPPDEAAGKDFHTKKLKKKELSEDKPIRSPKRVDRKPKNEKIDLTEIKSEIELEELKEKIVTQKETAKKTEKHKEKEKQIAYEDKGSFGSIFASKLDEVVKEKPARKNHK